MRPSTRASLPHCLFCSSVCTESTPPLEGRMEGAVHCPSLERHLLQFFILRHLLDVPSEWCEQTLQAVDENGDPDSWFRVCGVCITKWVGGAWQTYQKLMDLEIKMRTIKEGIRESMMKGFKLQGQRLHAPVGIERKIKTLIFADLLNQPNDSVKSEPEAPSAAVHFFGDLLTEEGSHADPTFSPLSIEKDVSEDDFQNEDDDVYDKSISKRKRRISGKNKRQMLNKNAKRRMAKYKRMGRPKFWHYCGTCSTRFSDPQELEGHLVAHEESNKTGKMFECKICCFPARDSSELDVHTNHRHAEIHKKAPKSYPCSQCDFTSGTWKALKIHFESEHPDAPEAATNFELQCSLCMKEFVTRSTLIIHQKKMHPEMFGTRQESIPCDQCTQLFPSLIHLRYHVLSTHSRITRFVCDTCGKGFRFIKSLERHKISHDKGKREFVCHICGCDYAYQSILDAHYRKIHPEGKGSEEVNSDGLPQDQELFTCKYCDMKTPFKPVILRHMQTHKETMGNQCDICGKYYTNYQGLKRHKRINHSTTNEVVKCPHCFKEFPTMDYMKTHITRYCKLKHLKGKPHHNDPSTSFTQEEPNLIQFSIQETPSASVSSSAVCLEGFESEPQLAFTFSAPKVENSIICITAEADNNKIDNQ